MESERVQRQSGQPDIDLVLMSIPGPPMVDDATHDAIADLMGKGFAGTIVLTTDDVHKAYRVMGERGVEFVDPPTAVPYASFRDPSGNNVRLTQLNTEFFG